jgi:hypothetical protein
MRINSAGNVSIGGFASNAMDAGYRFINFSDVTGAFVGGSSYAVQLGANVYINTSSVSVFGGGSFKASKYTQFDGGHFWYRSTATPVAGNDVVWSQPMTLDNGGNLLVGTTSNAGVTTNTAQVVGGVFSTATGTVTAASNTATTIFTATTVTIGCYIVTIGLAGSGTVYNTVGLVVTDQSASKVTILSQGALSNITSSGLTVQATQTSGISQTIYWTATRVS